MEQLEKYIIELEKDVKIDQFNVRDVQLRLPAYKHKWVGRLMRHKYELSKLYAKKFAIKKQVTQKICETTTYKVTKTTAEKAADNHDTIIDVNGEIEDQKIIVEFLEKSEKILSSMTFDIKNIIEVMKLETT